MAKQVFQTPLGDLTNSNTIDIEGVGNVRYEGQALYRWVQNKHGSAVAAGNVVFHLDTDAATFFQKVYDGLAGDLSYMAGVVVSTSIAANSYGWIQIEGYNADIDFFASGGTAIAVGDSLIGVDTKLYVVNGAATGTAPLHVRRIIALEALASSVTLATSKKGIIQCF